MATMTMDTWPKFLDRHCGLFSAIIGIVLAFYIRKWSKDRVEVEEEEIANRDLLKPLSVFYSGETKDYKWTQNEDDVEIFIESISGLTKQDTKCEFHKTRISVMVQNKPVIVGNVFAGIDPDESTWQFDRSKKDITIINITLRKEKPTLVSDQWRCVIKGHVELDPKGMGPQIISLDQNDPESIKRAVQRVKSEN